MNTVPLRTLFAILVVFCVSNGLFAKDLYVSATNGRGKQATKEAPAKDLGNIIELLEAGDTVHIAGGTYLGKGSNGFDEIIVPISIIGGYDETFTKRDPWGKHQTIMSGDNLTKNYVDGPRVFMNLSKFRGAKGFAIVIDGLIIDNAGRNNYKTSEQLMIVRMASPKEGKNPTPEGGGIVVWIPGTLDDDAAGFDVTVRNCVIMNTAPTQGALTVRGGKNGKVAIINNLIINNTGVGIFLSSAFHGSERFPKFTVEKNTVFFTWKFDPIASAFSGVSLQMDADVDASVSNNVFGFADRIGIGKNGKQKMKLKDNIILTNLECDLYEAAFDARIMLDVIEDESSTLTPDSTGNTADKIKVPVSAAWAKNWGSRVIVDRNAKEADLKVQESRANDLRAMLGLPLQAGVVKGPESPIWLNRMQISDAIAAGSTQYNGNGCSLPK